jgi:hypothetical protein
MQAAPSALRSWTQAKMACRSRTKHSVSRSLAAICFEVAYVNLGQAEDDFNGEKIEAKLENQWTLYGVGVVPISERWELFGKLGVVYWDTDYSGAGADGNNDGTDLAGAFGIGYKTEGPLGVRLEVEGFDYYGGIWFTSLSLTHRF